MLKNIGQNYVSFENAAEVLLSSDQFKRVIYCLVSLRHNFNFMSCLLAY